MRQSLHYMISRSTCLQAAMQLTPKQTASLLEARTCLLARLMEIIQGRKSIISMLKVRDETL